MAHLPTEIVHEILLYLPTPFHLAKMRTVCRRFNDIAIPVLHRHINLGSITRASQCCLAIDRSSAIAHAVRTFVVSPLAGESHIDSPILISLLDRMLFTMTRLEHLHLWLPTYDDAVYNSFTFLNFPALRRFGCHQPHPPVDHKLVAFFDHHPALTHLEIIRPYLYVDQQSESSALSELRLPALREYRGSTTYFLRIAIADRCLTQASFWDVPAKADLRPLFPAVAKATTTRRQFSLKFLWDGFLLDRVQATVLAMIAQHLPNLQSHSRAVSIQRSSTELGSWPLMAPCAAVTNIGGTLTALKHLAELHYDNPVDGVLRDGLDKQNVNNDRAVVTQWGERCPTLVSIQLHNRSWLRGRDGKFALAVV
ncbi:hypothetical protein MSAN_01316700 [Mycena sanguinolenta]|uniref:F-box domain-containing protein n=1 Tax=Mycena sanguinolenta TaxID=230812 RepID=A0A8H6YCI9_9AGAR|nr:hypothetical protein MSAN_01316700 [Mycena sanguinolenta]